MTGKQNAQATVHTAPRDIPVQHVVKLMAARGVRAVVVVEDHKPIGIVTGRDIMVRVTAPGLDATKVMVGTIMSSPLVVVPADESVHDAIAVMGRHGVRRLPVVDEAGRLVMLLALDDLLRFNLADSSGLTDIIREQTRRPADGFPNTGSRTVTRFADVAPPPNPPRSAPPATVRGLAAKADVVPMVKRRPLTRLHFAVRAWYRHNRLPILLMIGAAFLGAAVTFYVSAFYSYKPAYYEPKEGSREIHMKQQELEQVKQDPSR